MALSGFLLRLYNRSCKGSVRRDRSQTPPGAEATEDKHRWIKQETAIDPGRVTRSNYRDPADVVILSTLKPGEQRPFFQPLHQAKGHEYTGLELESEALGGSSATRTSARDCVLG